MKKLFISLMLMMLLGFLPRSDIWAAIVDVSQPVQVTDNSYYERGQSIIYDGSDYWLFYGRSAGSIDPYSTGNPDVHDYNVYYKKASTIAGLSTATAVKVPMINNANGYLGETDAAVYDGYVRVYTSVDVGSNATLYEWSTNNGGSSWTERTIATGLPDGAAHFAATSCDGKLWVVYKQGGNWQSKYWNGSSWSSEYTIITASGTGKFYCEGTNLYFVRAQSGDQTLHQWGGSSWSQIDISSEAGAYDPSIFKVGSNYVCAYAPWDGTKQYIPAKVGTSLSTILSTGSIVNITLGSYGTEPWVDMWPIGFTDNGGTSYMFFTSERDPDNSGGAEGTGNIWYLEVDWDLARDHYTYIQNAIDNASFGDIINVDDGTYNENVNLSTAGVILKGLNPPTSTALITGTVDITADNTSFMKFKVSPAGVFSSAQAAVAISASNVNVLGNIVEGVLGDGSGFFTVKGIHIYSSSGSSSIKITGNTIRNIENQAGTTSYGGASGISVQGVVSVITLEQNTIHDIHSAGWAYGIEVTPTASDPTNPPQNVIIEQNFITKVNDGSKYTLGASSAPYPGGLISIDAYTSGPTVYPANAGNVTAKYNFLDNAPGCFNIINKDPNNDLNASVCWWGTNDVTLITPRLYGRVDYSPWLDVGTDLNLTTGFQPDLQTVWVDKNSPPSTGHIQEGIDEVSNSTVYVLANDYAENLSLNQNVTLIGIDNGSAKVKVNPFNYNAVVTSQSAVQCNIINFQLVSWDPAQLIGYIGGNSNFTGNVIFTDCEFYKNISTQITDCNDLRDNYILDGFDGSPYGPGRFDHNNPRCAPFLDDLLLWLDPTGIGKSKNQPVDVWPDNTPKKENAVMTDPLRQPIYSKSNGGGGIEGFPSVLFAPDYGDTKYGYSDILTGPESAGTPPEYLTTASTERWDVDPRNTSLFIVFQTGTSIDEDGDDDPYYSDGRQCVFEVGGPLSGFNCYISGGKLCFGMWNRFEQKFLLYDPPPSSEIYPLDEEETYMAHLEYNGTSKQFRAVVNHNSDWNPGEPSPILSFQGLSRDANYNGGFDDYGVGGASRTRYHDYNIGETHSDHYRGKISEVMLYDSFFDVLAPSPEDPQDVYDFLNIRYNNFGGTGGFIYPATSMPKQSDWKVYDFTDLTGKNQLSEAYPNPFKETTSFGINLVESQRVTIELYDSFGKRVALIHGGFLSEGMHDFSIDGSNLVSGIYVFRVSGENFTESGKVILNK